MLPIHPAFVQAGVEAGVEAAVAFTDTERRVLRTLRGGSRAVKEIVTALGQKTASGGLRKALDRLDELGLIALTVPDKPRSKNQTRRLTEQGQRVLALLEASGTLP